MQPLDSRQLRPLLFQINFYSVITKGLLSCPGFVCKACAPRPQRTCSPPLFPALFCPDTKTKHQCSMPRCCGFLRKWPGSSCQNPLHMPGPAAGNGRTYRWNFRQNARADQERPPGNASGRRQETGKKKPRGSGELRGSYPQNFSGPAPGFRCTCNSPGV